MAAEQIHRFPWYATEQTCIVKLLFTTLILFETTVDYLCI
jgi:hypothetical protein